MNILKITKKSLYIALIVLFTIAAQFTLLIALANKPSRSYAYSSIDTADYLDNARFESSSSTSTGKPNTPSYWSAAGGDETNTVKGVIDTNSETFKKNNNYGLERNPQTSTSVDDNKILMIHSQDQATRFGYMNSTAMELKANGYYIISVLCKTNTATNGASIYLTGSNKALTNQYNFIDITTNPSLNNGWNTFTFYVRTDIAKDASLYLELWLGSKQDNNVLSKGSVFFDNISITSIDQNKYFEYTKAYNFSNSENMPATIRKIDLTGNSYAEQFANSNFEAAELTGWTRTKTGGKEDSYSGLTIAGNTSEMLTNMHLPADQDIPGSTSTYNNTHALYINHLSEEGSFTEYTSEPITIAQYSYAMISVYTKTKLSLGGAHITVTEVTDDAEPITYTTSDFTSDTSAIAAYNDYCLTTIYLEGNPFRDVDITLTLGLGKEDTLASGYAIFDDIQVFSSSHAAYSAATTNKLKLHSDKDTTPIYNGAFNFGTGDQDTLTYPINPRNWVVSNDVSGIVNVNSALFNANKVHYGASAQNPGPINYPGADTNINTTKNNVLMLRNDNSNSFVTATSDSISIEEGEDIVALDVYAKVQGNLSNDNSGAYIYLTNNNKVIAQIPAIKALEWTKYTIYIKNARAALNVQLVLSLGTKENPTSGYAYFDYVVYRSNIESNELETRDTATSTYTNLANNNFDSYIENNTGVNTPTTMTAKEPATAATTAGVINTSSVSNSIVNVSIPNREGKTNNNVLMIKNNAPTAFTYETAYSYTFNNTDGNNYVISLWIYTANLSGSEEKYGVNISLTNVEKSFTNVKSKTEDGEGVWTKYSFYIFANTETAITSTLSVSLGSEKYPTQGYLFVDAISINTIDTAGYNSIAADEYTLKTVAKIPVSADTNPEENPAPTPQADLNIWVLLSSIILALALIVAIVGYMFRHMKIKLPKFGKSKKSDYNRELNLNNADIKRELADIRSKKLKELDKQIAEVKVQMEEAKHTYEESIKDLDNEQKIEKLFTKYAKANSKLQTEIDNLESAKKYITDEANIRLEEQREIRKRQLMLEEENKLLKQNQEAIEKEKQKEKAELEAKKEAGKQKARLKSKQ